MHSAYYTTPWLANDRLHRTSRVKRLLYWPGRRLLSGYASRLLSADLRQAVRPALVLPGRGMPLETRRRWAVARCRLRSATLLVQGTGTGWDLLSWARLRPRRIIATDLFEFADSWREIADYCRARFDVEVEFRQAPLEDHAFLPDASIDVCASDAVFEHCTDLGAVVRESFRILKPGGTLYAGYGPMWFGPGGDHFSGRGGLRTVFNHVLLSRDDYRAYFEAFLTPDEDFQSGGRYVELDLFSRLRTREYYRLFDSVGFAIDALIVEISRNALGFRARFPDLFRELREKYAGRCTEDDFLISANLVRLIKPG
jgi:SAM-dependent methyltransferase